MEPSADEYRDALSRVVAAATFRSSPKLAELLSYLVEQKLAGHGDRLKGYPIALDVFGRDEDFDASSDSIVRVQMTRLRRALGEYYAGEGAGDPFRLVAPAGLMRPCSNRPRNGARRLARSRHPKRRLILPPRRLRSRGRTSSGRRAP